MKTQKLIFLLLISGFLFQSPAMAGEYDIKQMTPEIQSAMSGRQSRYNQLQDLKSGGVLGENNQGLVEVLKPIPEANSVASAENSDRMVIYNAIAAQNNLGAAGFGQVKRVFAEVQREKARSGDSVQLPNGQWVQK